MHIYKTPAQQLHLLAVDCIVKSRRSADLAVPKFMNLIAEDPELLMALVGGERLNEIALQYLRNVLSRDMDGGGIGLSPKSPKKTGSDAAADEAGQRCRDAQSVIDRPSAPQSQTPAAKLVGGGHSRRDAHLTPASPSSHRPWSPSDIALTEKVQVASHLQNPPIKGELIKTPYRAPKERVSAEAQARMKNEVASTVLDTLKVRGLPIGDWTHEKAMEASESMEWDSRILRAFAQGVPPGRLIREFITPREAENILKKLEAARAA